MSDTLSIALSGLMAQNKSLGAAASNIANATTTGALPTPQSPVSTVYKPLNVSYTSLTGGGVTATVTPDQNGYSAVYDPSNGYANNQGLVAAPNVDLARQIVNIIETKTLFKANVSVIKTENKMLGDLLDTVG